MAARAVGVLLWVAPVVVAGSAVAHRRSGGPRSFASLTDPGRIDQANGRYMTPIRAHAKGFVRGFGPVAPPEANPHRRVCGAGDRRPGPRMVGQKERSTAESAEHAEIQGLRFARSVRILISACSALSAVNLP